MFNHYQTDPYSLGDPENAIAARGDLRINSTATIRVPFGGIDSKVTSATTIQQKTLRSQIICGPTHYNQKPFDWRDPFFNDKIRLGMYA